jgi:hypothetical protein
MDYKEIQKQYAGKFIAILNDERIVASGNTFNEVVSKLQGMRLVNKAGLSIRFIRPAAPSPQRTVVDEERGVSTIH